MEGTGKDHSEEQLQEPTREEDPHKTRNWFFTSTSWFKVGPDFRDSIIIKLKETKSGYRGRKANGDPNTNRHLTIRYGSYMSTKS